MQKIVNPFQLKLETRKKDFDVIKQQMQDTLKRTKESINIALQIGTDSRVDEAILFTFLANIAQTMGKSIHDIYKAVKTKQMQNQLDFIENEMNKLTNAGEKFELLQKSSDNINKYQILSANRSSMIQAIKQGELTEAEIDNNKTKIDKIDKEMQELTNYFKVNNLAELEKEINNSEIKTYGEANAQILKDFRETTQEVKEVLRGGGIDNETINNGEIPEQTVKTVQIAAMNNIFEEMLQKSEKYSQTQKIK